MSNELILVVEDDDDIREALVEILGDTGYRTASAENGQAALELLTNGLRPQLILLDLMMPVMAGDAFLRHEQARLAIAGIPVLILSASSDPTARSLPGVAGWVEKPFHYSRLMNAVTTALDAPQRI